MFATLTASFSLQEIIVSAFTESGKRLRKSVSWVAGIVMFIAGIPAALSMGTLNDVTVFQKPIFDATDYLGEQSNAAIRKFAHSMVYHSWYGQGTCKTTIYIEQYARSGLVSYMEWIAPVTIVITYIYMLGII